MATNTGIEVTALRPAASAGDFYVRPEAYDPSVANGLARLSGTMNKKQNAEAKAEAEYLTLSENLDPSNVKAIRNMDAYAHKSLAVQARVAELRGAKAGNLFASESRNAWNEWKDSSSADGGDFEGFFAERKAKLAQELGGNKYMIAGAMGRMREVESSLRAQHGSYLDSRLRQETSILMDQEIGGILLAVSQGHMTRDAGRIQVEQSINDTAGTGVISRSEATKNSFNSFVKSYRQGNWFARELAEKSVYATGPNGKSVTNIKAIQALEDADDYVAAEKESNEATDAAALVTQQKQAKIDAKNEVAARLGQNPFQTFGAEDIQKWQGMGYDRVDIKGLQAAYVEGAGRIEDPTQEEAYQELIADIKNAAGTIAGPMSIDDINAKMQDFSIHSDRYQTLVSAVDSAMKVNTVLSDSEASLGRKNWVTSIAGDFNDTDPETGRIKLGLINDWNAEVHREVLLFEKANGTRMDSSDIYEMNGRIAQKFENRYADEKLKTNQFKDHNRLLKSIVESSRSLRDAQNDSIRSSEDSELVLAGLSLVTKRYTASEMFRSTNASLRASMSRGLLTPHTIGDETKPAHKWLTSMYGEGSVARWFDEFGGGVTSNGEIKRSEWQSWTEGTAANWD